MIDTECKLRPDIQYPCQWAYTLIGPDEDAIRAAVANVLGPTAHTLAVSKRSAAGRYTSLKLEVTVRDEPERKRIFRALSESESVRVVL